LQVIANNALGQKNAAIHNPHAQPIEIPSKGRQINLEAALRTAADDESGVGGRRPGVTP
jgi:hypothetical protein